MKTLLLAGLAGAAVTFAAPAHAVTTLTFEGLGNLEEVGNFYAPDYTFSKDTLAIIDEDAGGTGSIANEPSGDTVMFFLNANNAVLNATNGFSDGFSFFYSSSVATTVNVYSGLNATGTLLASLDLTAQYANNCSGDPTGAYCNWSAVGVKFAGQAYSIDFGGAANQTAFDNITFGSETPGTSPVPEPATWALMMAGLGLAGGALRRRSAKVVATEVAFA